MELGKTTGNTINKYRNLLSFECNKQNFFD